MYHIEYTKLIDELLEIDMKQINCQGKGRQRYFLGFPEYSVEQVRFGLSFRKILAQER